MSILASSLALGSADYSWRDEAVCRDTDPDLFFPIGTTGQALLQIDRAKQVCNDYNPIHDIESKRFCVPGDLLFALTLNNFGSKSQDFYITDDGMIGADQNDYFAPNLSTMINFYPYTGENFNIGGSFGLSIPISGESKAKGINFLLGPSLHFGSKSRLSLSGGLAYGPVQKLTNGLEVGSDASNFFSVENFTKDVYDFGYFFGISFSLFDIN